MPAFAHFDAEEPLRAAICISSFLVSVDDEGVLVGRIQDPVRWMSMDRIVSGEAFRGDRWVLPATHLLMGEHPEEAARRIVDEQLGARCHDLKLWRVLSFAAPMPSRGQELHWDLCFVYTAELEVTAVPTNFSELRRLPPSELSGDVFSRGHGEVLESLGVL